MKTLSAAEIIYNAYMSGYLAGVQGIDKNKSFTSFVSSYREVLGINMLPLEHIYIRRKDQSDK